MGSEGIGLFALSNSGGRGIRHDVINESGGISLFVGGGRGGR